MSLNNIVERILIRCAEKDYDYDCMRYEAEREVEGTEYSVDEVLRVAYEEIDEWDEVDEEYLVEEGEEI